MHTTFIAQLLIRTAFGAVAFLLLTAAYSNREFFAVFPFWLQTIIDVLLSVALLYTAIRFEYFKTHHARTMRLLVGVVAFYIITTQALSLWYYIHEIGTIYIAQSYGSLSWFLITQGALDVGVPTALLGLLYYSAHRYTTATSS